MKADIVIATYNGAARLQKTLASFEKMAQHSQTPIHDWRILIVNNNSSDNTREVALSFQGRLPLEVIDAPMPGKSAALNSVIPLFKADTIIFSDDDVELYPDWLDKMLATVEREKEYDVFAGRITGYWEQPLPGDLAAHVPIGSTYAIHDKEETGPCDPGIVWGPNMAIRKSVFDAGHKYNEVIGPQPKKLYPMGQDSEMAKRLSRAGHKSYFVGDAIVKHTVKAATVTEEWIIKRAERLGYGIFAVKGAAIGYSRKYPFMPIVLELILLRIFWACIFPLTTIMPAGKHRFWSRWKKYFYRGLLKSYFVFGQ
ncbi:MAG: hypothetical protein DI586_05530 [Micavibrio aeruginosavorus]|uniref:Glycosyltransferase 2-like domain-containing protein n=1 Tax=Micavibrio aeruginosavorus TaxID=349221 RepID=A0A2W5FLJ8_9BACT|nr:MAG: hypothetical protein DI586_05530 [Micavibrio aeruginosavorus]